MLTLYILCYLSDVWVLGTYALIRRRPRWFDWCNLITAFPAGLLDVYLHAWPQLALSVAFAVIAACNLVRSRTFDKHN